MAKIILLFSHKLTIQQKKYLKNILKIENIINLETDLQYLWSNFPPDVECISEYLDPIKDFLLEKLGKNDYVLVQGDFGATYMIVDFCIKNNLIPIYATTKRVIVNEVHESELVTKKSIFEFERFRKYGI